MRVGHHDHPLGLRRCGAALEFLSNSRGCRNALAHRPADLALFGQLSYFAKIVLVFISAISNV
jgi:hypothetical protein